MVSEDEKNEPIPNPAAEIDAMGQVARALGGLDPGSRERVITWAFNFYLGAVPAGQSVPRMYPPTISRAPAVAPEADATEIPDMATLFSRAMPASEAQKALVAGYYFQKVQGMEDFDSFRLNSELKHLGHRVTNITRALTALMSLKPQLVVQTRKEGKSQQARKRYKLTHEGIKRVERMAAESGQEE